jgi:anti-sigma regulatory factor (Ser/Thr protein kinase)
MTAVEVPGRKRTLRLEALPKAIGEARHWAGAVASDRLEDAQRANLKLVISEIVTNALRHGAPGQSIDVAVTPKLGYLCVQVTDDGPGLVPRPRALEPDLDGGYGLYFVEQLTRRWGVTRENRRTRVWFELDYAA